MNKLLITTLMLLSLSLEAQEITHTGFEPVAEEHVIFSELTRSKDRAYAQLFTICNHNFGGGASCNVDYYNEGNTEREYIDTYKLLCDAESCVRE